MAGPELWGNGGSEFWCSLVDRPKRSPKLFLPVEVDVRVNGRGGVGKASSLGILRKELKVDDLPRIPSLERVGEDLLEALDPCRMSVPGAADADFWRKLCDGDGIEEASP